MILTTTNLEPNKSWRPLPQCNMGMQKTIQQFCTTPVPHFKDDLNRYLSTPSSRKPYTIATSNPQNRMGLALAQTFRVLNADAKKVWMRDNIFRFCLPKQLSRFLKCVAPGSALLSTWPRTFERIVIVVSAPDNTLCRHRSIEVTIVVPLSAKSYLANESEREERKVDHANSQISQIATS